MGLAVAGLVVLVGWVGLGPELRGTGNARLQWLYELMAAGLSLQVAAFALSRFGLERRRLPLFVGLAFLSGTIADGVAAALSQGRYWTPLISQTDALGGVFWAGRAAMAGFLVAGLVAERRWPVSRSARAELVPAVVLGAAVAWALVQGATMIGLPGRVGWHCAVAGLLGVAWVGFFRLFWRAGGSMTASVVLSVGLLLAAQVAACQSAAPYDGAFMTAVVLKAAACLPPLVGLFVDSIVLFRVQQRLTGELRAAQGELAEYSRGLEQKVAERTQALERRAKELEAFAYTVSHDLKAPLRGVQTYADFLLQDYAGKLETEGRRYVTALHKAAGNMRMLIDDLLEYSRLERRETELGAVDLRELVASVVAEREPVIEQVGAAVRVEMDVPAVAADRAMVRLVLTNLVDNALKYSARSNPPRVTIRGRTEADRVVVSVADNGVGFDMQYRDKIFEIFTRLHRPDEFEGTGIGLSIVKRAIEKHGGTVTVQAAPGAGATFEFTLPRREAAG
jgi:signal transduction histidine kinase